MSLNQPSHRAVLALGSNLGHRFDTLQAAVDVIVDTPGVEVVAASPVYETKPVGGPPQPDYLNAVLVLRTALPPTLLLERAHAVEQALHRVREERWAARTVDVDVIVYDDLRSDDPNLTLPHPRAHLRAFVLAPWHDVEPDAVLPGHGSVADLLAVAADRDDLSMRADLRLQIAS
jgi:2-amino-4-hydroxy-6-hydroxymethyldihydropteridine diphosphokinase